MHFFALAASCLITQLVSSTTATPSTHSLTKRCTNSADDRSCWGNYDLSTNYYDEVPDTGVTVEVYLELVNTTASLDGVERNVLLVNGTFPGPTIIADWGDTVVVHLYNGLENNGSSIHFHGIRQNYTNQNDGVTSITQCPVAPGESTTYTWRATQYGTSWYHSHFALQGPPTLDNGLINGTNVYDTGGSRFEMDFVSETSYRLRLVNGAIDTMFRFMIDNHAFEVIAMDFVPIVPYTATYLNIGIGQRYDIIVTANQSTADYWMRAIPQTTCSDNDSADNIKGIIRYDSTSTSDPTTSPYTYTDSCDDEALSNLVPYLALDASDSDVSDDFAVTIGKSGNVFKWFMAATTFVAEWDNPTLLQIYDGNDSYTDSSHVIELPTADEWVYFIIETTNAVPHPIHLHGHDFSILAQGTGTYATVSPTLQLTNPPRRDVAMLPGGGYLVIGFQTDNPGAWLMHCHIGWHTSEGFALQLVERVSEIPALIDDTILSDTCTAWNSYVSTSGVVSTDSDV
ncbi:hypothetical protein V491_06782 [Pseudogymnoascus sp. VKM F-3775]|nr:hypothetical protein V491_06782 [Pseudogymnoascus sp. VKM F-3775]